MPISNIIIIHSTNLAKLNCTVALTKICNSVKPSAQGGNYTNFDFSYLSPIITCIILHEPVAAGHTCAFTDQIQLVKKN